MIDAVYHSTCGGSTENCEDVWTNPLPYLRSVQCGYCASSPRYTETLSLGAAQVAEKLGVPPEELKLTVLESTPGGRIIKVSTGKETLRGLEFRQKLGLRSAKVTWLKGKDGYSFTSVGYGHGVGLCQYGAKGLALHGYNYRTILGHYYSGAEITETERRNK